MFLQEKRILHRDLKPENLFYGYDGICKWGDLGFSVVLTQDEFFDTKYVGTYDYSSPELIMPVSEFWRYSVYSDVWAFGATLMHLLNCEVSFYDLRDVGCLGEDTAVKRKIVYRKLLEDFATKENKVSEMSPYTLGNIQDDLIAIWGVDYENAFIQGLDNEKSLDKHREYYFNLRKKGDNSFAVCNVLAQREIAILAIMCMQYEPRSRLTPIYIKNNQDEWLKQRPRALHGASASAAMATP